MNKDTYAKLVCKDGVFELSLEKDDQKSTLVYKNTDIKKDLEELKTILDWPTTEEMLANSLLGDETTFNFDKNLDNEAFILDLDQVKASKSKINEHQALDISDAVAKELKINAINDITASALECVYEHFAAEVFKNLQELVIYKLVLTSDELKKHKRLIELFGQNAGIIDIEVTIE